MRRLSKFLTVILFISVLNCGARESGPQKGDEIHIGTDTNDYKSDFNIHLESSGSAGIVGIMIYSSLFEMNGNEPLTPDLALSYTTNADKTIWNIILRNDVFFHDGTPLGAEDVKDTFNYIKNTPDAAHHDLLESIDSINTHGPHEVIFKLKKQDIFFQYALKLVYVTHFINGEPSFKNGTGAFKVDEYDTEKNLLTLVPFSHYYKPGPYLNSVVIHFLPSYLEGLSLLTRDGLDFLYLADPAYEKLFDSDKNFKMIFQKKPLSYVIEFNSDSFFRSSEFRKYVASLIPRDEMSEKLLAVSHTVSFEKLSESKIEKPVNFPQTFKFISIKEHEFSSFILYQLIQPFYANNIKINPQLYPLGEFLTKIGSRDYDMALYPANFSFEDLYIYRYLKQHSNTKDAERFMQDIRYSNSFEDREKMLENIKAQITKDPPFLFVARRYTPMIIHKRFKGYEEFPIEMLYEVQKMWVPKEEQKYL